MTRSRAFLSPGGLEGVLWVLAPLPLLLVDPKGFMGGEIRASVLALCSLLACGFCATQLLRHPPRAKLAGILATLFLYAAVLPRLVTSPAATLVATILLLGVFFFFLDLRLVPQRLGRSGYVDHCGRRAWGGMAIMPVVFAVHVLPGISLGASSPPLFALSWGIALGFYLRWAFRGRRSVRMIPGLVFLAVLLLLLLLSRHEHVPLVGLGCSLVSLLLVPRGGEEKREHWWDLLLNHPARVLLTTFLGLCSLGTLLLLLPHSAGQGTIAPIDAVFTSVSAVCVTGLTVLDTPVAFSPFGQGCILLLIQFGGLGIMSTATLALYAIGRRLSLRQERLMTSITETGHHDLLRALITVICFTLTVEACGALLLTLLFHGAGDTAGMALWRGVFTAISAFCNAGFALQSANLVPYQSSPLVLHIVALLIIMGGIAPATCLTLPRWLRGKPTPVAVSITIITTLFLLFSGAVFFLVFEWNGALASLSLADKLHNAWFQSATLRTAGFNSVDITNIAGPTFLIALVYMFIGGSPGGTAGGVKTTTIGILALTFRANIVQCNDVVLKRRRIPSSTVYRAVTLVVSALLIWFVMAMMLLVTQQIPARDLIFEVTSALATVGLSTGATTQLNEIGKIIIILTMFIGRIGPMTLFMQLSNDQGTDAACCLEEKISLT